jgi:hypothetical protein
VGRSLEAALPAREGRFRVAAVGELQFADGTRQPFVRRSRPSGR